MSAASGPASGELKVAVAGASGFVGRSLVSALASDHRVRALGRTPRARQPGVEFCATDLFSVTSSVEALAGIDVAVCHAGHADGPKRSSSTMLFV